MIKKLFALFFTFFLSFAFIFILLMKSGAEYYDNACSQMIDIANDPNKMNYLNIWATQKFKDEEFLRAMGRAGEIRLMDQSDLSPVIGLNWKFLGIDERYAFIQANRLLQDRADFLDGSKTKSISVGEGRFYVILKINGSNELGLEWPVEYLNQIITVNNNVSVVCDG